MKRLPYLALASLFALIVVAQPVIALPGPDPVDAPQDFSIVVTGTHDGETEVFDEIRFNRSTGYDFGDREAYRCAFVEYIVGQEVQFKLEFERLSVPGHDANYIVINDRHGLETGEGGIPGGGDNCGLPAGGGSQVHDGSPLVPGGASLTVYKDALPFVTYALPAVAPGNDETFWSVGNEPGEAYMWYVEEGEANDAVVRMTVIPVAPGLSLTPEAPHPSDVTLQLVGHLKAIGDVRIPDGTVECLGGRTVLIERRVSGSWRTVGQDVTAATGHYVARIADRDGTYRSRVLSAPMANGSTCEEDVSGRRTYRH